MSSLRPRTLLALRLLLLVVLMTGVVLRMLMVLLGHTLVRSRSVMVLVGLLMLWLLVMLVLRLPPGLLGHLGWVEPGCRYGRHHRTSSCLLSIALGSSNLAWSSTLFGASSCLLWPHWSPVLIGQQRLLGRGCCAHASWACGWNAYHSMNGHMWMLLVMVQAPMVDSLQGSASV